MVSIGMVLVIIAFCFYLGILYTNPPMVLLGYTLAALGVISVLELVYRFFTIKAFVDIPISMVEPNMPVVVVVKIRNEGILPAGKVVVKLRISNSLQTGSKSQWITVNDIGVGENCHEVKLTFHGAGCYEVEVQRIRIHSLFGLVNIKKKCKDFGSVLILPDIHFSAIRISEGTKNFMGDADVYDEFRPGNDTGETFEIRAYRPKDKLQSIHWKLSAKMDDLMVKENSLPKACAIVLFLNLKERLKKNNASACLELVASISFCLMDQKCPHFIVWYSKEIQDICRIRIDDEEAFYLFWDSYLRQGMAIEKDIREEYKNKYKNEWYLHDLTINEKLEIYKDGQFLCQLDGTKIKDECEKLEILL